MKKFIFFIILSELLLSLTISIERNKNSIIPYYLRLGSDKTLITFISSYDTLTHQTTTTAHLHVYIKLFSKKITKTTKNTPKKPKYTYQYKSNLGIKTINKKLSLEFDNSFKYNINNFTLYEEIAPAIPFFYKENTTLELHQKNKVFFISKTFTYNVNGMDYSLGIDTYKIFLPKFINTITFSLNGNTTLKPLIYSYNISTSYRRMLFGKKYIYLNINPYILVSKDYEYKIKPAINISINYNF